MQINSSLGLSQEYVTALQNKQASSSSNFSDELTTEDSEIIASSSSSSTSVSKVEEPQERYHEVYTYGNTKGMTYDEIDEYFSERTEEERNQIKFAVGISNKFSESDEANEALFTEAKNKISIKSRQEFSIQIAMETEAFSLGSPTLNNVLVVSDEYYAAIQAGIEDPSAQGIYMNAAHEAILNQGSSKFSYNDSLLNVDEAGDFLSTMTKLAKDKMEQAEGTAVYNDYKEAYRRYTRMNDTYNDLLSKSEEKNTVNITI